MSKILAYCVRQRYQSRYSLSEHNIGRNTLYRWRQKFSGMGQKMQYSLKNLKTKTQNSRDVYRDDIGQADI